MKFSNTLTWHWYSVNFSVEQIEPFKNLSGFIKYSTKSNVKLCVAS